MRNLIRTVGLLAAGFAGLLFLSAPAGADEDSHQHTAKRVPLPSLTEGKGEECVEPEDVMRRDHMNFILHQRDETMHRGIRTAKYSLKECIDCHVVPGPDGQPVSIKSRDHFCNSCHAYAAVTIDCFQCHSSQPTEPMKTSSDRNTNTLRLSDEAAAQPLKDMLKAHMVESEQR